MVLEFAGEQVVLKLQEDFREPPVPRPRVGELPGPVAAIGISPALVEVAKAAR